MTLPPFYLSTLNQARQWLSISIMLASIVLLLRRSYFKSLASTGLALCVHFSAIVMVPLLPILQREFKLKSLVIFSLLLLLFCNIFDLIWQASPYANYRELVFENEKFNTYVLYISVLLPLILNVAYSFCNPKPYTPNIRLICNMATLSAFVLIFGLIAGLAESYFVRINMYFQVYILILPLMLQEKFNNTLKIVLGFAIILVSTFYYFYTVCENGVYYNLIPYHNLLY